MFLSPASMVAEDMRSTLDTFKQDLNSNLPRRVRTLVEQISGEVQGKRVEGSVVMHNLNATVGQGSQMLSSTVASLTRGQVLSCNNRITKLQHTVLVFTRQAVVFLRGLCQTWCSLEHPQTLHIS
jgi:hypothetical protein